MFTRKASRDCIHAGPMAEAHRDSQHGSTGATVESDSNSKALELRIIASRLMKLADELEVPAADGPLDALGSAAENSQAARDTDFTGSYAETIFRVRQLRARFFPTVPFADPAWDLLLDLYWRGLKGEIVTVSNACMAAGVPTTTALRWIDILIDLGLVTREADVADRRRILLRLAEHSRSQLKAYLSEITLFRNIPPAIDDWNA